MSTNEYAAQYLTALVTFEGMTSKDKAGLVAIVRTGLIAIATAPGTIEDKATVTGVSQAKIGRDIITGLWLAKHPEEDAVKVKICGNKLSQTKMNKCNTVAELRALMPKPKPKEKTEETTEETTEDSTDTPEDTETVTKVTTPDSQMLALVPGMLKTAKNVHDRKPISAETQKKFQEAFAALAKEWNAYVTEIQAATDAA
jgi:hypothetical protein